jgi:hypothetical protein
VMGFFEIGSCTQTICLDWLGTSILLISASWIARITGVSHQCPAYLAVVNFFLVPNIFWMWILCQMNNWQGYSPIW